MALLFGVAVNHNPHHFVGDFEVENPVLVVVFPEVRSFVTLWKLKASNGGVLVADLERQVHHCFELVVFLDVQVFFYWRKDREVAAWGDAHVVAVLGVQALP